MDTIYNVTTVTDDEYEDLESGRHVDRIPSPPSRLSSLYSARHHTEEFKEFYDIVIDRLVCRVVRLEKRQKWTRRARRAQACCLLMTVLAIIVLAIAIGGIIFHALPQEPKLLYTFIC